MSDETTVYGFDHPRPRDEDIAGLMKEIRVRVLNCSSTGCLLECDTPLPVRTVAVLRVAFGGEDFEDSIEVVRCQAIGGAGVHHLGTRFLWTTPPYAGTLRFVVRRETAMLTGSLRPEKRQR